MLVFVLLVLRCVFLYASDVNAISLSVRLLKGRAPSAATSLTRSGFFLDWGGWGASAARVRRGEGAAGGGAGSTRTYPGSKARTIREDTPRPCDARGVK